MITLIAPSKEPIRYSEREGVLVVAQDIEKTAKRAGADVAIYYDRHHRIDMYSYQGKYLQLTWHSNPYSGPAKTIKSDSFCLSPFYMAKAMTTMKQWIKDLKAGEY